MTDQPAPSPATPGPAGDAPDAAGAAPPSTPPPSTPPSAPVPTRAPSRPGAVASPLIWIVSLVLAAVVGAALFVGGYLAGGGASSGTCTAPTEAFAPFCEAYTLLHKEYVDPLDDVKLAEGAIEGMFQNGVADPFSAYMPPDQYQSAKQDLSGTFSGIGAEMGVKNLSDPGNLDACSTLSDNCVLVVISPLDGQPAQAAGVKTGDILVAVDGTSVNGSTLEDEVGKIRGPAGTDVTLTLRRDAQTLDITVTRAEIKQSEVESHMLPDGKTGYIALHGFTDAAATDFHDQLATLINAGATAVIFDLRDNPGGYIEAARKVASEFVASGLIFSQESSGDQGKDWDASSGGAATDPKIPVVVLVNGGSASASEIVTAALKEHDRATVIGQHTYGKNTVQIWSDLGNGGGVRITISRWFTPDHNSVAPGGIQPDVSVQVPDNPPAGQDLYLQAAQTYLATHATGQPSARAGAATIPMRALDPSWSPVSYDAAGLALAFD